jgi:hypothetical protein
MDSASISRLIARIPERAARARSGSRFAAPGSARMDVLRGLLHWLGPLSAVNAEDQQALGARAPGGRPLAESDESAEDAPEPENPSAVQGIDLRAT